MNRNGDPLSDHASTTSSSRLSRKALFGTNEPDEADILRRRFVGVDDNIEVPLHHPAVRDLSPEGPLSPPCWCCDCFFLCNFQAEHSFLMRCFNQYNLCLNWASGAYASADGNHRFRRGVYEAAFSCQMTKPIPRSKPTKEGVYSNDIFILDADGNQMKCRIYDTVNPQVAPGESRPLVVYFHGGGFATMHPQIKPMDFLAQKYAKQSYVFLSVDYRLAPENPFPDGLRDCYAAVKWVCSPAARGIIPHDCDPLSKLVLMGDSAGGNFALIVGQLLRDELTAEMTPAADEMKKARARHLVLVYPALHFIPGIEKMEPISTRMFLTKPVLHFYSRSYLVGDKKQRFRLLKDRRVSPWIGGFEGLPPVTLLGATDDPLFNGCKVLDEMLKQVGVECKLLTYKTFHGFWTLEMFFPIAREARLDIFEETEYLFRGP